MDASIEELVHHFCTQLLSVSLQHLMIHYAFIFPFFVVVVVIFVGGGGLKSSSLPLTKFESISYLIVHVTIIWQSW